MDLSRYDNSDFDRGASVVKEVLWRICQGLFFQPLWHMPSGFRVLILRLFGDDVEFPFYLVRGRSVAILYLTTASAMEKASRS